MVELRKQFGALLQHLKKIPKSRLLKMKKFVIPFSFFMVILLLGAFSPILASESQTKMGTYHMNLAPSGEHVLGTDSYGRDVFAVLVYGIANSFRISTIAAIIGILIGLGLGLLAGYKGGIVDHILRGGIDTMMVIPTFLVLVIVSFYVTSVTVELMAVLIAIFAWPGPARIIRAQTRTYKAMPFLPIAKISGAGDIEIVFKEILPNILPYVGVIFADQFARAIVVETSLNILGLAPPGLNTLGNMLYYIQERGGIVMGLWWWFLPPVTILVMIFASLNIMNMALDQVYNPKLRKG